MPPSLAAPVIVDNDAERGSRLRSNGSPPSNRLRCSSATVSSASVSSVVLEAGHGLGGADAEQTERRTQTEPDTTRRATVRAWVSSASSVDHRGTRGRSCGSAPRTRAPNVQTFCGARRSAASRTASGYAYGRAEQFLLAYVAEPSEIHGLERPPTRLPPRPPGARSRRPARARTAP